ncbi:MAG: ChaN family lipoprotein [Longimicrobiales bacterium]|nr:ChaN family lipoprotein [Longimicrobiales bacterium]
MRTVLLLPALAALAGCASAPASAPHPPITPADTRADAPSPAPREGVEFAVFRGDGTPATLPALVAEAGQAQVVLFGEEHDDAMTHRLQTELLQRLFLEARPVVLSLEMFERDVQIVVDEYLQGLITEAHFLASARPWDHYEERYRPAVEFAREHGIPVVAANAPRRYVNRVSRLGPESLSDLSPAALAHLPPLPYYPGSERYRAEWDALMEGAAGHGGGDPFHGQVLWDASMGESIARTLERMSGALVLHFAGSFHVANHTGTPEALAHYRPGTRTLVLVSVPAETLDRLPEEHRGAGDFVVLTTAPTGTS